MCVRTGEKVREREGKEGEKEGESVSLCVCVCVCVCVFPRIAKSGLQIKSQDQRGVWVGVSVDTEHER